MGDRRLNKEMEFKRDLDPEKLRPRRRRPPGPLVESASKDIPGVLLGIYNAPEVDSVARLLHALRDLGHYFLVCEWAFYEHVKAGRIKVKVLACTRYHVFDDEGEARLECTPVEGSIEVEKEYRAIYSTPELGDWWEQAMSDGEALPSKTSSGAMRADPRPDRPAARQPENEGCDTLDGECRSALRHYDKAVDAIRSLSPAKKFYLICRYWKDVDEMTPAKIRDRFIEEFPSSAYDLPGNNSGTNRVKGGLARGKALLDDL